MKNKTYLILGGLVVSVGGVVNGVLGYDLEGSLITFIGVIFIIIPLASKILVKGVSENITTLLIEKCPCLGN